MDSWIWQPGYPLVSVKADGDELVLTQRRFSFDPDDASTSRWAIPVAVRHGGETHTVLLDGDETRLPLGDGPVIVNAGGHGFFRVSYADDLRARLTTEIVGEMTTLERYNLVDDAWSAVTAQTLDGYEYLELVERFGGEREHGVWQAITIGLRGLRRLTVDDVEALAALERRVVALCGPVLAELGDPVAGEPDLTAKLRGLLLGVVAVIGGNPEAAADARRYYDAWMVDASSVDAELVASATAVVAATGDATDYDRMLELTRTGDTPQVQLRHLYLLAEFDGADLMERTLELAMSDEVKSQNAPFLLRACIANLHQGRMAWEFVRRHWGEINEAFPRNTISRIVETVKTLDRPADVVHAQAFFSEHPIEQATKTLDQILERQRVNAEVRSRNEAALRNALR
jgi:puromycin-sensitive aminopeptidase